MCPLVQLFFIIYFLFCFFLQFFDSCNFINLVPFLLDLEAVVHWGCRGWGEVGKWSGQNRGVSCGKGKRYEYG